MSDDRVWTTTAVEHYRQARRYDAEGELHRAERQLQFAKIAIDLAHLMRAQAADLQPSSWDTSA